MHLPGALRRAGFLLPPLPRRAERQSHRPCGRWRRSRQARRVVRAAVGAAQGGARRLRRSEGARTVAVGRARTRRGRSCGERPDRLSTKRAPTMNSRCLHAWPAATGPWEALRGYEARPPWGGRLRPPHCRGRLVCARRRAAVQPASRPLRAALERRDHQPRVQRVGPCLRARETHHGPAHRLRAPGAPPSPPAAPRTARGGSPQTDKK